MKTNESVLVDFIKDFNLEVPNTVVCFTADVEFITASLTKKFNCEVQIITMLDKKLTIVYLLHIELAQNGIPDIFPFHRDNFFYNKMKNLTITDYDLLRGKYSLVIAPLNVTTCKNETMIVDFNLLTGK